MKDRFELAEAMALELFGAGCGCASGEDENGAECAEHWGMHEGSHMVILVDEEGLELWRLPDSWEKLGTTESGTRIL